MDSDSLLKIMETKFDIQKQIENKKLVEQEIRFLKYKGNKTQCINCKDIIVRKDTNKHGYHWLCDPCLKLEQDKNKEEEIEWERCDGCNRHELSCRCGVGSPWY